MKVLSLFDGISCGMLACQRANIPVEKYIAYEIDENAVKISKKHFPQIENKGNVFEAVYNEGDSDLLIGGSPCTFWSNARAKGTGREITPDGEGGKLFMQFVRAVKESKPKWFVYENNNSMSKDIKDFITKQLGVEPILINSDLVSGQVRRRLYWTNIPNVSQPKDKGIRLIDCLERFVDDKYYLSDKMKAYVMSSGTKNFYVKPEINLEKARPLTTATGKRAGTSTYVTDDFVNGGSSERMRRLTPLEYERLQTLPDNYTAGLSDTARYKAVGNGWTVDVIAHILSHIKENKNEG